MSYILSWNCRGLGSTDAINALKRIVFLEIPHMVFLMETKLKAFEMEKIKYKIKFSSCFIVDCEGEGRRRRGGLALLWNNSIDVNIRSFSLNHIDARVRSITQDEWRFSGIYGHPDEENKYKIGQLLISLKGGTDTPWLCGGDLILMLHSGEKQGGRVFDMEEAEILRDVVGVCELEDLGFIGHDFTWSNNRGGEESIQERLDRFLANRTWRDAFQGSFVTHLTKRKSDHLPILLCVQDVVSKQKKKKKKKLYRFEDTTRKQANSDGIVPTDPKFRRKSQNFRRIFPSYSTISDGI
ncbi:uncharacterized protein LOC110684459 [Chenopodium quinoa]|uniref:uncharacterized protein LOC110684459 n=1 Tax=Chenopodium quinoa TaxID=63459 RepID=UPI000B77D06B|nr:uncharacterized protein LOC110684459 [Chenopodium quinoa]